jgi:hypothetical protein
VTDPISRGNIERLYKYNPETAATDHELFRKMNESEDFRREMLKGAMALQHGTSKFSMLTIPDFTQYWPEVMNGRLAASDQI